ncbi:MAG: LacI family DNA-binding transcriptional regulator [Kyrpidia sp.]|nr:LacI family DNA-binding transcriptional regulator [Kyrpidia sp.]
MATIRDVAKLAGVSVSTVSRVLNGGVVSPDTEARVNAAMKTLNYRPNRLAQGLVRQKTMIIGLIIPDITNPFFPAVARGVEDAAGAREYGVLLCNADWDEAKERFYLRRLEEQRVDGLVFAGPKLSTSVLAELPVPVVLIDRSYEGMDTVWTDNFDGARQAVSHLVSQGCSRIAHIAGPDSSPSARERLKGYQHALRECGREEDWVYIQEGDFREQSGYRAMKTLLALRRPPDGVFAANDLMAVGALRALEEAGVRVPGEVALIGFDGIALTEATRPRLSTVVQPAYELGRRAAELLFRRLEGDASPPEEVLLAAELAVRESSRRR